MTVEAIRAAYRSLFEIAFVTFANFTEWAQEHKLEAGILIRDEGFARSLRNQYESLIAASRLRLLPGSASQHGAAM